MIREKILVEDESVPPGTHQTDQKDKARRPVRFEEVNMNKALLLLTIVLWPAMVFAELQTKPVDYREGSTVLEGYLAVKKGIEGKQPGVLVVPDWMGLKKPYMDIADKLADMGYVAFAADIYGKGVRPANSQEAAAEATKYKTDRKLLRQRVLAGLEELKKNPHVDHNRITAIGYCFGGPRCWNLPAVERPWWG